MVDAIDWCGDQWDGHSLNVRWLDKAEFFDNAPHKARRNREVVFVVPSLLLVDEWARDVAGVLVLNQLDTFVSVLGKLGVLRCNRAVFTFRFFSGSSLSGLRFGLFFHIYSI